jgi:hypothetical protein
MEAKEKKKPNQKEDYRLTEAAASWKTVHLSCILIPISALTTDIQVKSRMR